MSTGALEVLKIAEGLWRWDVPHPAWRDSDDWGRMVGCVYAEPPPDRADALLLVDPLLPPEGEARERFWRALDRDVERLGLPLAIAIASRAHGRSAEEVATRYGDRLDVRVLAHEDAPLDVAVTDRFRDGEALPGGALACGVAGFEHGETAIWLAHHRALLFADAVIGAGAGELRVAPAAWAAGDLRAEYDVRFRASLAALLELDPEVVVPSHGAPVLRGGRAALEAALEAPAWGQG